MNYSWFSADDWFRLEPSGLVHAGRLPTAEDSAYLQTDVKAAGNSIQIASLTVGPGDLLSADLRGQGPATVTAGGATFVFDNRGMVRANTGTLALEGLQWTSTTGTGTFLATANATNHFRSGIFVISNGVSFTFKGAGRHRFTGGLQVDGVMNIGIEDPLTHDCAG